MAEQRVTRKLTTILAADSQLADTALAFTYMEVDREDDARAAIAEVLRRDPKFTRTQYKRVLNYTDPAQTQRVLAALRDAGLPGQLEAVVRAFIGRVHANRCFPFRSKCLVSA